MPKVFPDQMIVRLPPGTFDRIDALNGINRRGAYIRDCVAEGLHFGEALRSVDKNTAAGHSTREVEKLAESRGPVPSGGGSARRRETGSSRQDAAGAEGSSPDDAPAATEKFGDARLGLTVGARRQSQQFRHEKD